MKKTILALILGTFFLCGTTFAQTTTNDDATAIANVIRQMGATWSSGDMKNFGGLLSANAIHVSPFGDVTKGSAEIVKLMQWVRDVPYKGAKLKMDVSEYELNYLSTDVAQVTFKIESTGDGFQPIRERVTVTVARVEKEWKIAHFQAVLISTPPQSPK